MMASEHPAAPAAHAHTEHPIPHVIYWSHVRDKAEECVKSVLEGGNSPTSLHKAIGKSTIETPEDWDELMDYCTERGIRCHDKNKLYRASVSWLQAYNELEYKRHYPSA